MADIHTLEDKLDLWLISGAERFRRDHELCQALLTLAQNKDSRRCLLLLEEVLKTPSLADRLLEVLRPETAKAQPRTLASTAQPKPVTTNHRTKRRTQ
jgi:hypothetical protein